MKEQDFIQIIRDWFPKGDPHFVITEIKPRPLIDFLELITQGTR